MADPTMADHIDEQWTTTAARIGRHATPALSLSPQRRSTIDKREKTFFVAHVVSNSHRYRCHVLNISLSGALIVGVHLPIADEKFDLELAPTLHPATVVWHDGGRCGVTFAIRLTPAQLDACF
jgi:hypothetical protein